MKKIKKVNEQIEELNSVEDFETHKFPKKLEQETEIINSKKNTNQKRIDNNIPKPNVETKAPIQEKSTKGKTELSNVEKYASFIKEASQKHDIPEILIYGIISQESDFQFKSTAETVKKKNDGRSYGPMQYLLMNSDESPLAKKIRTSSRTLISKTSTQEAKNEAFKFLVDISCKELNEKHKMSNPKDLDRTKIENWYTSLISYNGVKAINAPYKIDGNGDIVEKKVPAYQDAVLKKCLKFKEIEGYDKVKNINIDTQYKKEISVALKSKGTRTWHSLKNISEKYATNKTTETIKFAKAETNIETEKPKTDLKNKKITDNTGKTKLAFNDIKYTKTPIKEAIVDKLLNIATFTQVAQAETLDGEIDNKKNNVSKTVNINKKDVQGENIYAIEDTKNDKTTLFYDNNTKTAVSITGVRNERNNNPGNLKYNEETKKLGAIGKDGIYAIFPNKETGFKALESTYKSKTIETILTEQGKNSNYIKDICSYMNRKSEDKNKNFTKETEIGESDYRDLSKAISYFEGSNLNEKLIIKDIAYKEQEENKDVDPVIIEKKQDSPKQDFDKQDLKIVNTRDDITAKRKGGMTTVYYNHTTQSAIEITGIRCVRNNNPGNIVWGNFAKKMGAIGKDNEQAIFPDKETGIKAMKELLTKDEKYKGKTIEAIVETYASTDNDKTKEYISTVYSLINKDLKEQNKPPISKNYVPKGEMLNLLITAMAKHEGYTETNISKAKISEVTYVSDGKHNLTEEQNIIINDEKYENTEITRNNLAEKNEINDRTYAIEEVNEI